MVALLIGWIKLAQSVSVNAFPKVYTSLMWKIADITYLLTSCCVGNSLNDTFFDEEMMIFDMALSVMFELNKTIDR